MHALYLDSIRLKPMSRKFSEFLKGNGGKTRDNFVCRELDDHMPTNLR